MMNMKNKFYRAVTCTFLAWMTGISIGLGDVVKEKEAVAVADYYYAMEINAEHSKLDSKEKAKRLDDRSSRQVLYLLSKDDLRDEPPDGKVLAYVIKYQPKGFVIVSAEDRIDPVLVFGADSEFRFDHLERNFLRHYIATALVGRWENLSSALANKKKVAIHPEWARFRSRSSARNSRSGRGTNVLWDTPLWDQPWPYSETVVAQNGNNPTVPTGCTATAMAIKMRFHEWPAVGYDAHTYYDGWGSLNFWHTANFGAHTFYWYAMPMGNVTSSNLHVANLMYLCGVAVEMDYELTGAFAWPTPHSMNHFFSYKGTVEMNSGHEPHIAASVIAGCPVILSTSSHTVVASGYRDYPSPYFYLNMGYNGFNNNWYNLDQIPSPDPTIDRSYPYSSPANYIYTSWGATAFEFGTIQNPFDTLSEGYITVPSGGDLWVYQGSYTGAGNVPITFNKAMEIKSYGGTVTIK